MPPQPAPQPDLKIIEALAFQLYLAFSAPEKPSPIRWRDEQNIRAKFRGHAREVYNTLADSGLKLSPTSKLDSFVHGLAVVPSRMAYSLGDESIQKAT